MPDRIALWQHVIVDERLLERASNTDAADVAAVASLRRDYPVEQVAVALELGLARAKAIHKFGEPGRSIVADVQGLEQASGGAVAAYKAARIRATLGAGAVIADLCCGVGGDSMAMCDAGLDPASFDIDPLRAWMTRINTRHSAHAVCADVTKLALDGGALHLDPARRDEQAQRRAYRLDDCRPGPTAIAQLIDRSAAAAVKLSPGIELGTLPWPGEVEFISDRGRLVQAVLWTGALARDNRRATRVEGDTAYTLGGEPLVPTLAPAQRYLYTFDPSVERAGLIGRLAAQVDAPALHPKLGLLTSERVIDSPWLTGFELVERTPWRPKRVKQWLSANDGGVVEVKTRGKACDPDAEQRRLRGQGATIYTVFVLRFETKVQALITRRV